MYNRLQIIGLSVTSALIGGLSFYWFAPAPALAQAQKAFPKEVRSQNFVLVNAQGQPVGLFGFNPQGKPIIRLIDDQGKVIWTTEVPLVPGAPEPK
jgi:hypothetical protein